MRPFERLQEMREEAHRRFSRRPHGPHDHHERHERHEHPFSRGGRLARLLEHGDLKLLVLHLIAERPRHGYEIIKEIEDLTGGAYAPSPGVIYPTLTLLEELGQLAGTAEGSRKSYAITEAGTQALAAQQDGVRAILARIAGGRSPEPGLPVRRAIENLRTTLRLKLSAALGTEANRKIADALDAAARAIEEA